MSKSKVITANVLSAFATTVAALLTYAILDDTSVFLAYPLAITAGFFIYIASSDIIPEIHDKVDRKRKDIRPWLLLFGAVLVMVVSPIAHDYIDAGHSEENCINYLNKDGTEVLHSECDHAEDGHTEERGHDSENKTDNHTDE